MGDRNKDFVYGKRFLYDFKKSKNKAVYDWGCYLLDRTLNIFEYDGLPDTIPRLQLEKLLQLNGFACIAKDDKGDLYAFNGGLGGEPSPYYLPTTCIVANPALKLEKMFTIDKDCIILRNDSVINSLYPLISKYATLLAENDISLRMVDIMTRVSALITAPTDKAKAEAELFVKMLEDGELSIIGDKGSVFGIGEVKAQPLGASGNIGAITDLIEYEQYLKASFYNEIGLNANYNMKREAINTMEAQMNNDALDTLITDMLINREEGIGKINAMFGTSISVRISPDWISENSVQTENKEGDNNGNAESVGGDSVLDK